MQINFNITLTSKQQEAWDLLHQYDTRYLVCVWSRQCGKSTLAECCLIEYLCMNNKFSAYISPTYSQGRKVYKELVGLLEPTGIIKKANSSTLTIETIYNSVFQAFSADSPNSIRGYTVSGLLVLDEASFFPDELSDGSDIWSSVILPITKARRPKVLLISTPKGKRGFFYHTYLKALEGENGFKQVTANIYDDNLVTEEEIEHIKKTISPVAFDEEFLSKFLDSSLTFFRQFEDCFHDFNFKENEKKYIGVDLSANGDDATVLTVINESMQVKQHIIEGTLDQKYRRIADLINNIDPVAAYLENNGVGAPMINAISKLVTHKQKLHEWSTTNATKEQIISNLAVTIADKDIYFNKNDEKLFAELGHFVVKYTKTGKLQFEGKNSHDDMVMSLAIALQCKNDFKNTFNKNTFFMPNYAKIVR